MKMPKVDGYEYTGEWRIPKVGEEYTCSVACKPALAAFSSAVARPILRKAEVWKPLTLEKALEMGKTRKSFSFRMVTPRVGYSSMVGVPFPASVLGIDLDSATNKNVRLSYCGWVNSSDMEYLEE